MKLNTFKRKVMLVAPRRRAFMRVYGAHREIVRQFEHGRLQQQAGDVVIEWNQRAAGLTLTSCRRALQLNKHGDGDIPVSYARCR